MFARLFPALLVLAACDGESADTDAPTWYQDVAPLYAESCVGCHTDGGIGPFALDNYEDASQWADASAAAVEARTMPPWGAVEDGTCGDHAFVDSRYLDDDDIALVTAWVDAGMPEGDEATIDEPEADLLPEGIDIVTPEYTPSGTDYSEVDSYRCFLVDPGVTEDVYVTGYQFFTGNPEIDHHAILMPVDADEDFLAQVEAAEAEDGDIGWECWSGAGTDPSGRSIPYDSQMITWTPGQGWVRYPEGYGIKIDAGTQFVVQMHYNLPYDGSVVEPDSSTLRLETTTDAVSTLYPGLLDEFLSSRYDAEPMTIEADSDDAVISWTLPWDDDIPVDIDVWGVMPHMHKYGTKYELSFSNPETGEETCAIKIDDWDYDWQMNYFYEEPIHVPQGWSTTVTCHYDTTGESEDILPGWGTNEEMCLIGLFLAVHVD